MPITKTTYSIKLTNSDGESLVIRECPENEDLLQLCIGDEFFTFDTGSELEAINNAIEEIDAEKVES